jgi:hypothetical protein
MGTIFGGIGLGWIALHPPSAKVTPHHGQIQAAVITRDDLIRNKLATGREQDILDVKKLRTAKQQGST